MIIPCLNEAESIGDVVKEVLAQQVGEVLVVDNGSTDATAEQAALAGARVVSQPERGYGRACAAGLAAVSPRTDIVCFLDGDGSDVPSFLPAVVGPVVRGEADFVMGSRLKGRREAGSMTPQQLVAGRLAGVLLKLRYGADFSDMSPFRAARVSELRALGMSEMTYGWNLEMQMRAAAAGWRLLEVPVDHRCRRGGVSKVSGDLKAGLNAAWKITSTFMRTCEQPERDANHKKTNMRILLTGGAGFIGRHVLNELLDKKHDVRVMDSLRADVHAGRAWQPPPGVELLQADVRDAAAIDQALHNIDAVIHLAAKVGLGVDISGHARLCVIQRCRHRRAAGRHGARQRQPRDACQFHGGVWRRAWPVPGAWRGGTWSTS